MLNVNSTMGQQNHLRILVAEDNEINQRLIQKILQRAGYAVDIAENGREAVEFAGKNQYDFILMDIQMPLMDGQEAARIIRKAEGGRRNSNGENSVSDSTFPIPNSEFQPVPIVAMTGSNFEVEKGKCLRMGMNDCLGKPLFRDQLLSSITKWTATEPVASAAGQVRRDGHPPAAKTPGLHRPIDYDRALNEFMGEKEVLLNLLRDFTAKVRSQIKAIQQAILGMDFKAIARDAHSIKGGAANLTAKNVAGIASALEKAAQLQQAELAKQLAGELEKKLDQLENYVRRADFSVNGV
ncbi:MAG: response regulator [Deltaproteobacteria bacterium]|nr:response regulator [Deltaproteobacteria bacterium]